MAELTKEQIEFLTECLKEGKPIPEDYKYIIFPPDKKEYELVYANKEREEDILADTMAVPLQKVKTFGENGKDWTNLLIFGNNLQVLKTIYENEDPIIKNKVKGKVKLIYIDPPFGTGDIYDAKGNAPAYSAKLQGVKYIEFLRKRLLFLREILSDDGSIYVRIDYHFGHYIKTIMDEVFEKNNFLNEIVVSRSGRPTEQKGMYHTTHDVLLFYSKTSNYYFKNYEIEREERNWRGMHLPGVRWTKIDTKYLKYFKKDIKEKNKEYYSRSRIFLGREILPPEGRHWAINQENIFKLEKEGTIKLDEKGRPISLESETKKIGDNWTDISGYTRYWNYPTENSEILLERVIVGSSKEGDLVLDCFAGSGTTMAVAEKLGRKWIGVDCGKLSIYTIQKRLLNIKDEKKKPIKCKPFTLYNAGLYDYPKIKELPWEQYRKFALQLFQCRDDKHTISGIELDGFLGKDDVMVFNYQEYKNVSLDRDFIDDLHKHIGRKIGKRFFIIVPSASVRFLEDYIEKGTTKYFVLRIPYSIIEEIHNRGFISIKQPVNEIDVNDTVEAVGFDFIQIPKVECNYYLDKPKEIDLLTQKTKECVIKIKIFESKVISRKPLEFKNLETLSMVMLDYDHDCKVFDIDDMFYAEKIQPNYEIRFDSAKIKDQIMIIYVDIFGNEKREIKKLTDFKKKK